MPPGVTMPILLPANSVNHRFPSSPRAIPTGLLAMVGTGNSLKDCAMAGMAPATAHNIATIRPGQSHALAR